MQLKGERLYFGSVAGDTVCHGKEDVAACARVNWSHCIVKERGMLLFSSLSPFYAFQDLRPLCLLLGCVFSPQ